MMTNMYRRLILMGAALLSSAVAGYGQQATATINFPFTAQGVEYPAGTYEFKRMVMGASHLFIVRDTNSTEQKMFTAAWAGNPAGGYQWNLSFNCGVESCRLAAISMGDVMYAAPGSKAKPSKKTVAVALRVTSDAE